MAPPVAMAVTHATVGDVAVTDPSGRAAREVLAQSGCPVAAVAAAAQDRPGAGSPVSRLAGHRASAPRRLCRHRGLSSRESVLRRRSWEVVV
jgi:hypothetical protein